MKTDKKWFLEKLDNLEDETKRMGGTPDYARGYNNALMNIGYYARRIENPEITMSEAFDKIAQRYPFKAIQIENILAKVMQGQLVEPEEEKASALEAMAYNAVIAMKDITNGIEKAVDELTDEEKENLSKFLGSDPFESE